MFYVLRAFFVKSEPSKSVCDVAAETGSGGESWAKFNLCFNYVKTCDPTIQQSA